MPRTFQRVPIMVKRVVQAVCSFSAETPVATPDGAQAISTLDVGDQVLAYNEATETTGSYTITAVMAHADPVIIHLTIDDETLETTPEHPFFTQDRGWVAAGELQISEQVRTLNGTTGVVTALHAEQRTQVMYNLTVAVAHTFFVGDGQWLVHNQCLEYDIVKYGTKNPGFENHHGLMDVWAKHNIPGYVSRAGKGPAIALSPANHNATRSVFARWRVQKTGTVNGPINWQSITPQEIQALSEDMFDAAKVPDEARMNYYNELHKYIYDGP
jgi:hypothetical protein